jgi:hypothetical protein
VIFCVVNSQHSAIYDTSDNLCVDDFIPKLLVS